MINWPLGLVKESLYGGCGLLCHTHAPPKLNLCKLRLGLVPGPRLQGLALDRTKHRSAHPEAA